MWDEQDDEDKSDIEDDEEVKDFKPAFVAIAIDTHPLMFRKIEDGTMPFRNCLEACLLLADSLIFTQSKGSFSQFSVILAREDNTFVGFQNNLLDTVKFLTEQSQLSDQQLINRYQRKGDFDLDEFFLACKKIFHDIKSPFYKRTLIYITDDDSPVPDAGKRFTALNEAKTFSGNQISFQVLPTRQDFDYTKFYNELFSLLDSPPMEEICEDKEGLIQKLTSAIVPRTTKRKLRFYPFRGDTGRFLDCLKEDVIKPSIMNNISLTTEGKSIKTTSAESYTSPTYFFKCSAPGRDTVSFDAMDRSYLRDTSLPVGLTLLYVSKRIMEVGCVLGNPFLLVEDDKKTSPYFKRFWTSCVKNRRVLVCARKIKQPDKIRYVELLPILANGIPTFLGKNVAFASETSHPKKCEYPEQAINTKGRAAVTRLVEALTFEFDPKMIPDPCYREKEAYVKAKLLDQPMEEVDRSRSRTFHAEALDSQIQEAVEAIKANLTLVEDKKRKAPAKAAQAKKAK